MYSFDFQPTEVINHDCLNEKYFIWTLISFDRIRIPINKYTVCLLAEINANNFQDVFTNLSHDQSIGGVSMNLGYYQHNQIIESMRKSIIPALVDLDC